MPVKKIVVIGPESTGKSTLCRQLAAHYKTSWVPEFAREYLEMNGKEYTLATLSEIARGQVSGEDKLYRQLLNESDDVKKLFIDTDLYVIKVWSEFVFNSCDNRVLQQIALRKYDLYLLCQTDLPWEQDELREYPDPETRNRLFSYYKDAMVQQNIPWVEIKGNYEARLTQAIRAVENLS